MNELYDELWGSADVAEWHYVPCPAEVIELMFTDNIEEQGEDIDG